MTDHSHCIPGRAYLDGDKPSYECGFAIKKESIWNYENEIRFFPKRNKVYIDNVKPIRVIFGSRAWENELLYSHIRQICYIKNIQIDSMIDNKDGVFQPALD
jgi:hypothetical protein